MPIEGVLIQCRLTGHRGRRWRERRFGREHSPTSICFLEKEGVRGERPVVKHLTPLIARMPCARSRSPLPQRLPRPAYQRPRSAWRNRGRCRCSGPRSPGRQPTSACERKPRLVTRHVVFIRDNEWLRQSLQLDEGGVRAGKHGYPGVPRCWAHKRSRTIPLPAWSAMAVGELLVGAVVHRRIGDRVE